MMRKVENEVGLFLSTLMAFPLKHQHWPFFNPGFAVSTLISKPFNNGHNSNKMVFC